MPVAIALLIAVVFGAYYVLYVQVRREYLINRNFRSLAILGSQISEEIGNQIGILQNFAKSLMEQKAIRPATGLQVRSAKPEQQADYTKVTDDNRALLQFLNPNLRCFEIH